MVLHIKIWLECRACGKAFKARSLAKYCSNSCRQRAYRGRVKYGFPVEK